MRNPKSIVEIYGKNTENTQLEWSEIIEKQYCPYLQKKCLKTRKSEPNITIGSCTVRYGQKDPKNIMICPHRFLERRQIFIDCLHLLSLHEPGNEIHIVPEINIPGGNVDYFLVSLSNNKVVDFVGIELQTLDTTGTVWPFRQRLLQERGISVKIEDVNNKKSFGMNWKMTAKTILVQLHHKIETFEYLNKHLILVLQDYLLSYMENEFSFSHISGLARLGDPMQFHAYRLEKNKSGFKLSLCSRKSTDTQGIATCLGLESKATVELDEIIEKIQKKISEETLFQL